MKISNMVKLGVVATVLLFIPRRSSHKSSINPKQAQNLKSQQQGDEEYSKK